MSPLANFVEGCAGNLWHQRQKGTASRIWSAGPAATRAAAALSQYHVTARRFLPGQYFADQPAGKRRLRRRCRRTWRAADRTLQALHRSCELVRRGFGNARWPGDGDFVQAVASVDDERATQAQHAERLCKFFDKVCGIDADHLAGAWAGFVSGPAG